VEHLYLFHIAHQMRGPCHGEHTNCPLLKLIEALRGIKVDAMAMAAACYHTHWL
jgi:hypothetical protein